MDFSIVWHVCWYIMLKYHDITPCCLKKWTRLTYANGAPNNPRRSETSLLNLQLAEKLQPKVWSYCPEAHPAGQASPAANFGTKSGETWCRWPHTKKNNTVGEFNGFDIPILIISMFDLRPWILISGVVIIGNHRTAWWVQLLGICAHDCTTPIHAHHVPKLNIEHPLLRQDDFIEQINTYFWLYCIIHKSINIYLYIIYTCVYMYPPI